MSYDEPTRREVTDPRVMRAMAHPLRIEILELLRSIGPMTATQLSERVGESPANCSFHLRTLAKYGFVEEAGGGTGRQRPWQVVPVAIRIKPHELGPEASMAMESLDRVLRDRESAHLERWGATRSSYPQEWLEAWFTRVGITRLTPAELTEINDKIAELLAPYEVRDEAGEVPAEALPVWLSAYGFPISQERGR